MCRKVTALLKIVTKRQDKHDRVLQTIGKDMSDLSKLFRNAMASYWKHRKVLMKLERTPQSHPMRLIFAKTIIINVLCRVKKGHGSIGGFSHLLYDIMNRLT